MQLVVRVLDKYSGTDRRTQATSMMRGDVIDVLPDAHQFGTLDLTNPSWIILRISTMTRAKAEAMKSGDQFDERTTTYVRIRAFKLDLDALIALGYPIPTEAAAAAVRDAYEAEVATRGESRSDIKHSARYARANAIVDITEAHFDLAKVAKTPITDPAIIKSK